MTPVLPVCVRSGLQPCEHPLRGSLMFPGLPTSLHGGLLIGDVDEECQARGIHPRHHPQFIFPF